MHPLPLPLPSRGPSDGLAMPGASTATRPAPQAQSLTSSPAAAAGLAGETSAPDLPPTSIGVMILASLALAAAMILMRDLLAPMAAAALLAAMFWPIVSALRRRGVPAALSAALIVALLLGVLSSVGVLLRAPVEDFASRWPQWRSAIELRVDAFQRMVDGPRGSAAAPIVVVAAPSDAAAAAAGTPVVTGPNWWTPLQKLGEMAVAGAQLAVTTLFTLFLALFAFLAFGHRVVRAALQGFGRTPRARVVRDALSTAQATLQSYWLTVSCINLGLSIAVSAAFWLMGVPHALLWGALAGLMNFVPMVGPAVYAALITLVAFTHFDSAAAALAVPAVYLGLHFVEGQFVMPTVLGRRLSLNPAVVIVSILFWTWAWGVLGTLMAVPLLLCLKLVCEHHPDLTRVGALLE